MPHAFRIVALGILATAILNAQKGPHPGSNPNNPSSPDVPAGLSQPSADSADIWPEATVPILLSGTVLIEGTGPAANVAVDRLCGNQPHTVAWTNTSGQFSFQWNNTVGVIAEASDPGSGTGVRTGNHGGDLPGVSMMGCELIANAPGYRSDRVDLSTHRPTDISDLGTILVHRIAGVEGLSVSATALSAPTDARKAWQKGVALLRPRDHPDAAAAEKEFDKAVKIYPRYANAWLDLGRAREVQGKQEPAREAFLKAVDSDGKLVEPYIELGAMAARRQEWPDAARYLDRALELNAVDYPHLWYDDAEADYHVRNFNRAEKEIREALKLPPPNLEPQAMKLLGFVLLEKQDYPGARAALLAYVRKWPDAQDWDEVKSRLQSIDSRLAESR